MPAKRKRSLNAATEARAVKARAESEEAAPKCTAILRRIPNTYWPAGQAPPRDVSPQGLVRSSNLDGSILAALSLVRSLMPGASNTDFASLLVLASPAEDSLGLSTAVAQLGGEARGPRAALALLKAVLGTLEALHVEGTRQLLDEAREALAGGAAPAALLTRLVALARGDWMLRLGGAYFGPGGLQFLAAEDAPVKPSSVAEAAARVLLRRLREQRDVPVECSGLIYSSNLDGSILAALSLVRSLMPGASNTDFASLLVLASPAEDSLGLPTAVPQLGGEAKGPRAALALLKAVLGTLEALHVEGTRQLLDEAREALAGGAAPAALLTRLVALARGDWMLRLRCERGGHGGLQFLAAEDAPVKPSSVAEAAARVLLRRLREQRDVPVECSVMLKDVRGNFKDEDDTDGTFDPADASLWVVANSKEDETPKPPTRWNLEATATDCATLCP
ncbi:hypothetical protein EMIHUDRAFT_250925 [Emiliania huxleyi CCMP1516]|uniref:Uncharacterized protein n=2 Tax=Emiliania huxleyi TaxID=2903 RepID=A0A0D3KZ94_EMIH1|nr:hypothetical protein EMIHUDRAFT_250925 [Emiliania huxleyi CCMP1516]EOD41079.1 hypothetical protein EMIHUDRAFT_250925 [Emiliania huxleyi CCMP1516]|eukprot:XP_005793508.1 hypothetical protein EMIHUDRAFT_250925 [Emiliania huxleyi CCMP1516]